MNDLQTRGDGLSFPPEKVFGGAAALLEEVAATKISGEEDRYSHTDLYDFQGNIDGAKKIVDLFRGQIGQQDQAFLAKVDKNFATVNKILAKYKTQDGGFETYDKVKDNDRKAWGTEYATTHGLFVYGSSRGNHSPYWSRTQSSTNRQGARCIKSKGELGYINVITLDEGMRPACWLDMGKVVIASGEGTMENPFVLLTEPSAELEAAPALPAEAEAPCCVPGECSCCASCSCGCQD